jgi:hypothetical protein
MPWPKATLRITQGVWDIIYILWNNGATLPGGRPASMFKQEPIEVMLDSADELVRDDTMWQRLPTLIKASTKMGGDKDNQELRQHLRELLESCQ